MKEPMGSINFFEILLPALFVNFSCKPWTFLASLNCLIYNMWSTDLNKFCWKVAIWGGRGGGGGVIPQDYRPACYARLLLLSLSFFSLVSEHFYDIFDHVYCFGHYSAAPQGFWWQKWKLPISTSTDKVHTQEPPSGLFSLVTFWFLQCRCQNKYYPIFVEYTN